MGIKTKVKKGDLLINGEEVEFSVEKEDWNTYKLQDGTTIKFKSVVTKIIKLDLPNPQTNDPIYSVNSQNVVVAIVPEDKKSL